MDPIYQVRVEGRRNDVMAQLVTALVQLRDAGATDQELREVETHKLYDAPQDESYFLVQCRIAHPKTAGSASFSPDGSAHDVTRSMFGR